MKILFLGLFLLAPSAFAKDVTVQVKNFSFNYDDPKGSGSASAFTMSGIESLAGVQVAVEKLDDIFKISVTGAENEEIEFKDAPAFMKDAKHMDIENFNLDLGAKATLSLVEGNFNSPESDLMMKGFSLDCVRDTAQTEVMDQVLSGCMKKMTVRSSDFYSASKKVEETSALSILSNSIQTVIKASSRGETRVKSLKLNAENGSYDLAADVKADISGKVTSEGNMSYDPTTGTLTIKISQVKFSILNVTSKVFDELKKNESDSVKVKKPYVYITVK